MLERSVTAWNSMTSKLVRNGFVEELKMLDLLKDRASRWNLVIVGFVQLGMRTCNVGPFR